MTDAELQAQYQRAVRRDGAARAACPSPEQLQQLVERTGPEEERVDILDHVMSCADCHAELALLQGIHAAQPRQALLRPRHWLAAASLLIAFAGGVLLTRGVLTHPATEPMRGAGETPGDGITVVGASAPVAQGQPGTLTWHALPGAVQYTVEVLDGADRVLFTRQTVDTTVAVPALAAPAAWWVRAALADGTDHRSEIERLDVRR
jgi:hypothetical protein